MARTASRSHAITRHAPNPWRGRALKLQERMSSISKRARAGVAAQEEAAISVGSALVVGVLEARGTRLPSFMGLDPNLLWGAALVLGGPRLMKGKNGKRLEAAGVGLLACAAKDSAVRGSVKVGEDDEDDDD